MNKLKDIKCTLVQQVTNQLAEPKKVDAKELGEVIDAIKDLEEAMYYCAIIEAMEESKKEKEENKEQSVNNINYYMEPNLYTGGRGMGGSMTGNSSNSEKRNYVPYMEYAPYMMRDEKWRDARLYNNADRSYNSRRMYMESKQNKENDQQSMKELEHYIKDLGDDLTDMIRDSSPEEKQVLSNKLQVLASKVNSK